MKVYLQYLNGSLVLVNEDRSKQAQPLYLEEALTDNPNTSLQDIIDNADQLMNSWIPVNDETGWGEVVDSVVI